MRLKAAIKPHEILLVADGMTGQDAVRIAKGFHDALGITGVILTKMDGDARGGAALSIYGVTQAPIKYIGVGEKLDALEPFHPERMAGPDPPAGRHPLAGGEGAGARRRGGSREAGEEGDVEEGHGPRGLPRRAMKQMQKLGPLKNVLGMLPGVNAADAQGRQRRRQDGSSTSRRSCCR